MGHPGDRFLQSRANSQQRLVHVSMGQLSAFSHEEQHASVEIRLLPKLCICGNSLEVVPGLWVPHHALEFCDC